MDKVKISKIELLKVVQQNRNEHRELFLKAQDGYRKAVVAELDSMLLDARQGKMIRRSLSLPEPVDHTKDYDRVIQMLTMSIDETVELHVAEFDQYVMDNWNWKAFATASNMRYTQ